MNEDEVNEAGLEDENGSRSLGAYENMERSDIRPSFYSGRASEEDDEESNKSKNRLGEAERNAASEGAKKVAGKVAKKGLDAATGGVGGKVADAAVKAGEKLGIGKKGKGLPFVGKIAAAGAPALVIGILLILFCFAFLPFLQWLFPWGYQARMLEENNTTQVSAQAYTDEMLDSSQLNNCTPKSGVADVSYNDMGFTDLQVAELKNSGFEIIQYDDCSTAMVYQDGSGNNVAVVSSQDIGKTADGTLANDDEAVTDSGAEGNLDEERRAEIIAKLDDVAAVNASSVKTFDEAMKDYHFKDKYKRGAEYWRGQIAGWYTDMRAVTIDRQAISYDNFKDFDTSGTDEEVAERVMALFKSKTERGSGNGSGGKSLTELVEEVAKDSGNNDCGTSSAFSKIEGVTAASQTLQQEVAGSFLLESIDKTRAGEGQTAPLNAIMNMMNKASATTAPGIMSLFTNSKLDQSNELVQQVNAQAHGTDGQIGAAVNEDKYRQCIYEGNTDNDVGDKQGAVATISSLFQKISKAFKNVASSVKNLIFGMFGVEDDGVVGGTGADSGQITNALSNVISNFDTMKNQELLTGSDTAMLGEAMASASERQIMEKAQSGGLVLGTPESTKLTYRAQQDIIAEEAEYDSRNKSPFDITSRYTFLGSLAYSLMPFAFSSQNFSVTGTASNIGSVMSDSLVALLPTSSAVGETQINLGDCVLSNNIGGASNAHCISYRNPDLSMSSQTAVQVFDTVANMRFDEAGYVYGTDRDATVKGDSGASGSTGAGGDIEVVVFALGTNNRGYTHGGGADTLTQADIDNLAAAVSSDTTVFLVTNVDTEWSTREGMYSTNNSLLNSAVNSHDNWHLLDWRVTATTSDINPNDPDEWNVHPNAQGIKKWVDMIANAVKSTGVDGSKVAIIGDSITNMTTNELKAAIPGAYVSGHDGRTWQGALDDEASVLERTKGASGDQNVSGSGSKTIGKGTRELDDPDWGDGPLNAAENDLPRYWASKEDDTKAKFYAAYPNYMHQIIGQPHGCESDWEMRLDGIVYVLDFDKPTEWTYSRYTNFEYEGYQSGWHNRKRDGSVGIERAQNTVDPGGCLLDIAIDSEKQPVVNQNSALGMFLLAAGQRSSEWGVTDDMNLNIVSTVDFTKGRLHPCVVGAKKICEDEPYKSLEWTGEVTSDGKPSDDLLQNTSLSVAMSPWIGGSAFVYYNGDRSTLDFMQNTIPNDKRYQDATRDNDLFWNEMKWYQAFVIINEWMETIGKVKTSTATLAVQDYYAENPLDNSYEGIIARRSGLSKDDVVAVLDLIDYVEFLAQYDPTNLYPLPADKPEKLQYDSNEVVIIAEKIIQNNAVVYDELRNKTVAA